MSDRISIFKHEAVPGCGERFPDDRESLFYYWDIASRPAGLGGIWWIVNCNGDGSGESCSGRNGWLLSKLVRRRHHR